MSQLWEKVKLTLEQGAKSAKESAESLVKTVSEKAPQIASSIAEKSKDLAETVSDKTQDMVSTGQLKHMKYNLSREVSDQFGKIGKRTYDLIKSKKKDIVDDADVSEMILRVKELETAINDVDDKLEKLRSKELAVDDPAPEADVQSSESTDSSPQNKQ
ncbi:MAG: hypothetical protein V2J62_00575 [candidate division KSB1 bacterium]|jgi:hypothetical protein|nr:hypothetical protein [candidate division KSB1 bacterium]